MNFKIEETKTPEKWGKELKEVALFYAQILGWVVTLPLRAIWAVLLFIGGNPRKICQAVKGATIAVIVVVAVTAAIRVMSFGTTLYAGFFPAPVETSAPVKATPADTQPARYSIEEATKHGVMKLVSVSNSMFEGIQTAVASHPESLQESTAQEPVAQPDLLKKAGLVK